MVVQYSDHLRVRLSFREIPHELPLQIYQEATERYFDRVTQKLIAVKRVEYKDKSREMAVVYEKLDQVVSLITIHPLKVNQKVSRIKSGRWISFNKAYE